MGGSRGGAREDESMPERDNPGPERPTALPPTGSLAPAETEDTALQAAQQQVANLAERAKADPGVVFQADTLAALAVLRAQDPETWARVRQALQKAAMSARSSTGAPHVPRCDWCSRTRGRRPLSPLSPVRSGTCWRMRPPQPRLSSFPTAIF
jgi:hypothetical protein